MGDEFVKITNSFGDSRAINLALVESVFRLPEDPDKAGIRFVSGKVVEVRVDSLPQFLEVCL